MELSLLTMASMVQLINYASSWKQFCNTRIHDLCMKSYKFWSLLQCTVPESASIVCSPSSWLSPEPQPGLQLWRYPHYSSTIAWTFQKPCVWVRKCVHCPVFRPKVQFQDASRSRGHTSGWECPQTTSATVPQMPCLSKNYFTFRVKIKAQLTARHSSLLL